MSTPKKCTVDIYKFYEGEPSGHEEFEIEEKIISRLLSFKKYGLNNSLSSSEATDQHSDRIEFIALDDTMIAELNGFKERMSCFYRYSNLSELGKDAREWLCALYIRKHGEKIGQGISSPVRFRLEMK